MNDMVPSCLPLGLATAKERIEFGLSTKVNCWMAICPIKHCVKVDIPDPALVGMVVMNPGMQISINFRTLHVRKAVGKCWNGHFDDSPARTYGTSPVQSRGINDRIPIIYADCTF